MTAAFAGTGTLLWVALRRDRVQLSLWVLGLAALLTAMAFVMRDVFGSQQELERTVAILGANPVMRAFGLPSGASIGGLLMLRALAFLAVLVGLMSVMAVVRHTRQNEETRRAELIGSLAVGRHAALAAALLTAAIANVALALAGASGLMVAGLDASGAFAAGAALGATGLAFGGVAAVTAQISENSRGATGLAVAVIGVAFLLSSVGNVMGTATPDGFVVTSAWMAWLSPIGWAQQMRPFGGDHWWVLLLFAGFVVGTAALAFALERWRDVGRGLVPERRGPAEASPALGSALGLAWRLQRGTFLAWAVGVTIFGAVFGAVSNSFEEIISQVEGAADFFARAGGAEDLADSFYAIIIGLMATVITAYTIGALLRMRGEEAGGLLEPVLATAVSRRAWMASHAAAVVFATYALLLLTGLSTGLLVGLVQGLALGDVLREVGRLVATAMVQAPAVLVLASIALLAFAAVPRRSGAIAWAAFFVALVAGPMFGPMLDLPESVLNLSPFTHIPAVPREPFVVMPIVALKLAVVALAALAFVAFDLRDLDTHTGEGAAPSPGEAEAAPAA